MEEIITLFSTIFIQIILALIALDIVLGIIGSIVKKEFAFGKLAMFMKGPVLGYVLGFVIITLCAQGIALLGNWLLWVVFVVIVIALLGSLLKNLGRIGVPLPKIFKG